MYTPPPALVLDRFPLVDSPTQRRIRGVLLTALAGSLRETFWFAEAPVLHYALPLTPWRRDDVREVDEVIPCLGAWEGSSSSRKTSSATMVVANARRQPPAVSA
jgi:hypothetical protein